MWWLLILYNTGQHLGMHQTILQFQIVANKTFITLVLISLLGHFYCFLRYMIVLPLQTVINYCVVNPHHGRSHYIGSSII